jgi:hypothetical protein
MRFYAIVTLHYLAPVTATFQKAATKTMQSSTTFDYLLLLVCPTLLPLPTSFTSLLLDLSSSKYYTADLTFNPHSCLLISDLYLATMAVSRDDRPSAAGSASLDKLYISILTVLP